MTNYQTQNPPTALTTIVPECPRCHSIRVYVYSGNQETGTQGWRCANCDYAYTLYQSSPTQPVGKF